jgi:hypothetical protein
LIFTVYFAYQKVTSSQISNDVFSLQNLFVYRIDTLGVVGRDVFQQFQTIG